MKWNAPVSSSTRNSTVPGVVVAHRAADLERALVDRRACRSVQIMRGRLLDDFLVAPLHRAVTLVEMHQVAVVVP